MCVFKFKNYLLSYLSRFQVAKQHHKPILQLFNRHVLDKPRTDRTRLVFTAIDAQFIQSVRIRMLLNSLDLRNSQIQSANIDRRLLNGFSLLGRLLFFRSRLGLSNFGRLFTGNNRHGLFLRLSLLLRNINLLNSVLRLELHETIAGVLHSFGQLPVFLLQLLDSQLCVLLS